MTYPVKNCDEVSRALCRAEHRFRFKSNLELFLNLLQEVSEAYYPVLDFRAVLVKVLDGHKDFTRKQYEGYKFALGIVYGTRAGVYS